MMDKKQLLTETALSLFYERGVHSVGINEILKSCRVAKKTLYNHFESKEKLVEAAVTLRDSRFINWFSNTLESQPAGEAALMAMFDALDDWFNERVPALTPFKGCFFINVSAEYKSDNCSIYALCQQHKRQVRELLYPHCSALTSTEKSANALTDQILLLKEGAIIAAHVLGDRNAANNAKQAGNHLIATFKLANSPNTKLQ